MNILNDEDIYDFGRAEIDKFEERLNDCERRNKALRERIALLQAEVKAKIGR